MNEGTVREKSAFLRVLCIFLAVLSTLALHCRWASYGDFEGGFMLSFISKIGSTFQSFDFIDIIVLAAIAVFFIKIIAGNRFDVVACVLSLIMAVLYVICRQYMDFNSLTFLLDSKYALIVTAMGIIGYAALIYAVFVFFKSLVLKENVSEPVAKEGFFHKFFWPTAWIFILACYIPWIVLNYPGSGMPDTIRQFENYLGDEPWSMWQPPLSSLIMGWCYSLGKAIKDANFGFFMYALLQTVAASGIFSYAINRLKKLGASMKICVPAVLFYGLVPMWGAYAQWVEKDFLFAAVCVLFTVYLIEIMARGEVSAKAIVKVIVSGLLCMFLRNNGIYAVIPALLVMCFYVSKEARKRVIIMLVVILAVFEGTTRLLFPAVGVGRTSVSETIGFMFQQTARYVNTYPDEISAEEEAVLVKNFQSMETFANYNPKLIDPVKIYYNHTVPGDYFKLWIKGFTKHPFVYIESYLNGACGYLAPVRGDIGAYISSDFSWYFKEKMGLNNDEAPAGGPDLLIAIRNPSQTQVLIKYFTYPGAYTWCLILLLYLAACKRKKGAWAVFVPCIMTVLVCTVSPIACAMRYALPVAATVPILIGWTLFCDKEKAQ